MTLSLYARGAVVTLTDGTTGTIASAVVSRGRHLFRPAGGGLPVWVPAATITATR